MKALHKREMFPRGVSLSLSKALAFLTRGRVFERPLSNPSKL